MLVPGYTMPAAPAASDAATLEPAATVAEPTAQPMDVEGELPSLSDAASSGGSASSSTFHIRHGKSKYHIRIPQGLQAATFKDLAAYLSTAFFDGVPVAQFRFVVKGKTPDLADALGAEGNSEASAMLLFREGFHIAQDEAKWLEARTAEFVEVEAMLPKLAKRIEANLANHDELIEIAEARALVETLEQSVESVQVSETKIAEMASLRDRVKDAKAKLDEYR